MLFFETTPSGRILNRFTSDTEQVRPALDDFYVYSH